VFAGTEDVAEPSELALDSFPAALDVALLLVLLAALLARELLSDVSSSPPHAVKANTIVNTNKNAKSFFINQDSPFLNFLFIIIYAPVLIKISTKAPIIIHVT
jgi:hypothetical protein